MVILWKRLKNNGDQPGGAGSSPRSIRRVPATLHAATAYTSPISSWTSYQPLKTELAEPSVLYCCRANPTGLGMPLRPSILIGASSLTPIGLFGCSAVHWPCDCGVAHLVEPGVLNCRLSGIGTLAFVVAPNIAHWYWCLFASCLLLDRVQHKTSIFSICTPPLARHGLIHSDYGRCPNQGP